MSALKISILSVSFLLSQGSPSSDDGYWSSNRSLRRFVKRSARRISLEDVLEIAREAKRNHDGAYTVSNRILLGYAKANRDRLSTDDFVRLANEAFDNYGGSSRIGRKILRIESRIAAANKTKAPKEKPARVDRGLEDRINSLDEPTLRLLYGDLEGEGGKLVPEMTAVVRREFARKTGVSEAALVVDSEIRAILERVVTGTALLEELHALVQKFPSSEHRAALSKSFEKNLDGILAFNLSSGQLGWLYDVAPSLALAEGIFLGARTASGFVDLLDTVRISLSDIDEAFIQRITAFFLGLDPSPEQLAEIGKNKLFNTYEITHVPLLDHLLKKVRTASDFFDHVLVRRHYDGGYDLRKVLADFIADKADAVLALDPPLEKLEALGRKRMISTEFLEKFLARPGTTGGEFLTLWRAVYKSSSYDYENEFLTLWRAVYKTSSYDYEKFFVANIDRIMDLNLSVDQRRDLVLSTQGQAYETSVRVLDVILNRAESAGDFVDEFRYFVNYLREGVEDGRVGKLYAELFEEKLRRFIDAKLDAIIALNPSIDELKALDGYIDASSLLKVLDRGGKGSVSDLCRPSVGGLVVPDRLATGV